MTSSPSPWRTALLVAATVTASGTTALAAPSSLPAIVGGELATQDLPWIATLLNTQGGSACGGALIHPEWVITAGHCMEPNEHFPHPAKVRIGSRDKTQGGHVVEVTGRYRHRYYSTEGTQESRKGRYDVGLLKLAEPVQDVPVLPLASTTAPVGSQVLALGWGFQDPDFKQPTTLLKQLATAVLPAAECSRRSLIFKADVELCINNPIDTAGKNQGMCNGDSGSPLVRNHNGRWELAGIVSRETTVRCAEGPTVFSDPVAFRHWISKTTGGAIAANGAQPLPTPTAPTVPDLSWGLDRIDARGSERFDNSYQAPGKAGAGVNIYIVDTGVSAHPEFGDRLKAGYDAYDNDQDPSDCWGHGTHVASTAAGAKYGVAPAANIIPIKVTGCKNAPPGAQTSTAAISAQTSDTAIGRATDWILANLQEPAVVNFSLQMVNQKAAKAAVDRLLAAGVTVVAAAGNSRNDACDIQPAKIPDVITVAAIDRHDKRGRYSGWGTCVDLFAPGTDIPAANYQGGYMYDTGTSMASPHVAGAAALYMSTAGVTDRAAVTQAILAGAHRNVVSDVKGSPNLLLQVGFVGTAPTTAKPGSTQPVQDTQKPWWHPDGWSLRWPWSA